MGVDEAIRARSTTRRASPRPARPARRSRRRRVHGARRRAVADDVAAAVGADLAPVGGPRVVRRGRAGRAMRLAAVVWRRALRLAAERSPRRRRRLVDSCATTRRSCCAARAGPRATPGSASGSTGRLVQVGRDCARRASRLPLLESCSRRCTARSCSPLDRRRHRLIVPAAVARSPGRPSTSTPPPDRPRPARPRGARPARRSRRRARRPFDVFLLDRRAASAAASNRNPKFSAKEPSTRLNRVRRAFDTSSRRTRDPRSCESFSRQPCRSRPVGRAHGHSLGPDRQRHRHRRPRRPRPSVDVYVNGQPTLTTSHTRPSPIPSSCPPATTRSNPPRRRAAADSEPAIAANPVSLPAPTPSIVAHLDAAGFARPSRCSSTTPPDARREGPPGRPPHRARPRRRRARRRCPRLREPQQPEPGQGRRPGRHHWRGSPCAGTTDP